MSDALPSLTQMLLFWLPTFLFGVLVGTFQERHKETMKMDVATAFRLWYDRWAPIVVTLTALLAVVGIWIGTAATITNAQQDRRSDAATKAVQKCFDRYAQAQSASSKAVREASVVKDEATARRDLALTALTDALITGKPTPSVRRALAELNKSGVALVDAQSALDEARAENPVPDAPSEFCSVKP